MILRAQQICTGYQPKKSSVPEVLPTPCFLLSKSCPALVSTLNDTCVIPERRGCRSGAVVGVVFSLEVMEASYIFRSLL